MIESNHDNAKLSIRGDAYEVDTQKPNREKEIFVSFFLPLFLCTGRGTIPSMLKPFRVLSFSEILVQHHDVTNSSFSATCNFWKNE